VQFSDSPEDPNYALSIRAPIAFRITGPQMPGPDGIQYPELGIAANGSIDPNRQTWPTVEHYFRAMRFAGDPEWQEAIRTSTLTKAAQMSRDPAHAARGDWVQVRDKVMKDALLAKFRQNPVALATLQATGDRKLVDISAGDPEWFAGTKGRGSNRIGAFLEEVRTELKDVRADQAILEPLVQEGQEETETEPEPTFAEQVEEASGGIVQLAPIPEGTEGSEGSESQKPVQQGGVYLFINSAVGPRVPTRDRGSGRKLQWGGMSVSKEEPEQMTTDTGTGNGPAVEVSVEKLGA
jgi:hypothetical protein